MEACYDDEVSNCEISGGICESNSLAYIIFWGGGLFENDEVIIYTSDVMFMKGQNINGENICVYFKSKFVSNKIMSPNRV